MDRRGFVRAGSTAVVRRGKLSGVYETSGELAELQALLDASIQRSGTHLRDIVEPGRRTMTAEQVVAACSDVCVLNLATTTARGAPRLSAVDGHFLHGRWYFTTSASAVKARHVRARPEVSASWTPADGLGVWVHGRAAFLEPGTRQWHRLDRHLLRAYGGSLSELSGPSGIVYTRIDPHWMVGFAMTADELVDMESARAHRQERLAAPVTNEEL